MALRDYLTEFFAGALGKSPYDILPFEEQQALKEGITNPEDWEAHKQEKARLAKEKQQIEDREQYQNLVDQQVENVTDILKLGKGLTQEQLSNLLDQYDLPDLRELFSSISGGATPPGGPGTPGRESVVATTPSPEDIDFLESTFGPGGGDPRFKPPMDPRRSQLGNAVQNVLEAAWSKSEKARLADIVDRNRAAQDERRKQRKEERDRLAAARAVESEARAVQAEARAGEAHEFAQAREERARQKAEEEAAEAELKRLLPGATYPRSEFKEAREHRQEVKRSGDDLRYEILDKWYQEERKKAEGVKDVTLLLKVKDALDAHEENEMNKLFGLPVDLESRNLVSEAIESVRKANAPKPQGDNEGVPLHEELWGDIISFLKSQLPFGTGKDAISVMDEERLGK